jgi:hypothetical protein
LLVCGREYFETKRAERLEEFAKIIERQTCHEAEAADEISRARVVDHPGIGYIRKVGLVVVHRIVLTE